MNRAERALIDLCVALIGDKRRLTLRERKLAALGKAANPDEVSVVRSAILAGDDPLGERLCEIRPAELRREMGATYTPSAIVDAMIGWAADEVASPVRVVDPGAGSGRYLMAAASRFPRAVLIGVEIDPLAALILRANASVKGFASRLMILLEDYRAISLPKVGGPTLYIGNPPYVRHHDIKATWKKWFSTNATEQGFKASNLAGLHIHFFLKTRELAQPGDFGAFITAAEWLDVNYGSILRSMLANGLGGTSLHVIDPKARPFADALTTGAITCFRVGNRPQQFTVRTVESLTDLAPLSQGAPVSWDDLANKPRWSFFVRGEAAHEAGMIELGELFRVHRGQVTGRNSAWIENEAMHDIAEKYFFPTVTRARELIAAGTALADPSALRRVLDLPIDLDQLNAAERPAVERFLRWAKSHSVHQGYIASTRSSWWSVQLRDPPPILSTYMARRPPTFVRNLAKARYLNIAHGLYPRGPMTELQLGAVLAYLRRHASTEGGRFYAGGLVKFEPHDLERIRIPALDRLHEFATTPSFEANPMDREPVEGGRPRFDGNISSRTT
jgi:hypothetical protein